MCNCSTASLGLPRSSEGLLFDLGGLYAEFAKLTDSRKARGKRYVLAAVLILVVLAKLCGEDQPFGIAEWAQARAALLCGWLGLRRKRLPGHNTYRRVLRDVVLPSELQAATHRFLGATPSAQSHWLICIDGKTLRGTIPSGESQGVHLLAAYVPQEGVVLVQVAVDRKENEIVAMPRLLACLDLRGKVVVADAMLTQREASVRIVAAGGDYVWLVKGNQPQTEEAIEGFLSPEASATWDSAAAMDLQTAKTVNKGHGRLEERTLTSSTLLNDYLDWPHVAQVFRLERHVTQLRTGAQTGEVVHGLTSLTREEADAARLQGIVRDYWQIENGLHYRRDRTLHEDGTRIMHPSLAESMAIVNNFVIAVVIRNGWRYLPQARRHYSAHPEHALAKLLAPPG